MTKLVRVSYITKNTITGADYPKCVVGIIVTEDTNFITVQSRDNLIFKINKRLVHEITEVRS